MKSMVVYLGESTILFRAKEAPWSREVDEQGNIGPNKVTDGPYLFRTGSGRLGMIWTRVYLKRFGSGQQCFCFAQRTGNS